MRTFLILLPLLTLGGLASAETYVIYRKDDNVVASYTNDPEFVEQEILNMTRSELGGKPTDYAVTTIEDIPKGHRIVISKDGEASTEERQDDEPVDIPVKDLGGGALAGALAAIGVTSIRGTKRKEKS